MISVVWMTAHWERRMSCWPVVQPAFKPRFNTKWLTTQVVSTNITQVTSKSCALSLRLSRPQQSSCGLRWMNVCVHWQTRHCLCLLHNSLITELLPHTYTVVWCHYYLPRSQLTRADALCLASADWLTILNWLNLGLLSNSGGDAAPSTGLWGRYISSNSAGLSGFVAGDCHGGVRYLVLPQQLF